MATGIVHCHYRQFGPSQKKRGRRSPSPSSPRSRSPRRDAARGLRPRSAPINAWGVLRLALRVATRLAVCASVLVHELRTAVGADPDELQPHRPVTVAGGLAVAGALDADLRD